MSYHVCKHSKATDSGLSQWSLELNQNGSNTWLEYVEQTFVRQREEINIVVKRTRFYWEEGKLVPSILCLLEATRNRCIGIVCCTWRMHLISTLNEQVKRLFWSLSLEHIAKNGMEHIFFALYSKERDQNNSLFPYGGTYYTWRRLENVLVNILNEQ